MKTPIVPNAQATSAIGFGGAYLTGGWETKRNLRLVDAAYEVGYRHFDVAPPYGLGTAEDVLGRALRGRRQNVTIATKVGLPRPQVSFQTQLIRLLAAPVRKYARPFLRHRERRLAPPAKGRGDFSPQSISLRLADSLKRLQTDYVDVLLLHEPIYADITDELLAVLDRIRRSGQARAIGVAASHDEIVRICSAHKGFFDVCQYSWSPLHDVPSCEDLPSFRITHRAVMLAAHVINEWLNAHREKAKTYSGQLQCDLMDRRVVAKALIGAAIDKNPEGIVLVGTRQIAHVRSNFEPALDPRWKEIGGLLSQLAAQEIAPSFSV